MFESLESRKLFSTVTVAPVTVTEPTSGSTPATFTATLKSASASDVVVSYVTANRTAKAGSDYTATSGSVTIPAGSTSATFSVPVLADDVSETTETFAVHLTVSKRNKINGTVIGTIVDSDPDPTVTVVDTTVAEPAAGRRSTASVTVDLANPSSRPVTVYLHTINDSATAGTDYVAATKKVVVKAGQTSATTTFKIIGNSAITSDEVFDVAIVRAVNGTVDPDDSYGTVTILGTDDASTDTVSVAPTSVTEGNSGTTAMTFTVTLSSAQTVPVSVDYATSDGTAKAGVDYLATSGTLTFAAGVTGETVSVTVIGGTTVESDETLVLTLSSPTNAVLGTATAIGTIFNDDATTTPTLSVAAASDTASSSATTTLAFTVTLSSAATSAVTVDYATANGTAVAGTDYTAASGTLTIAAGATTGTVDVTVAAESATTATTKALTLTLSSASGATLGTATATGTISIPATITGTSGSTDLADNLSDTTDSTEAANGTSILAASFTATTDTTLASVTIPLSVTSGGAVTVKIYADGGLEPGTLVGTLTSPSSYSTSVTDTMFTGSLSLSASTTYWVVVTATAGTANWAWTDDTSGTGSGFTGEWASSADGGTTWYSDDNFPLQMQVLTT